MAQRAERTLTDGRIRTMVIQVEYIPTGEPDEELSESVCDAVADLVQDHADDWDILPASVVVECEDECEKTQIERARVQG